MRNKMQPIGNPGNMPGVKSTGGKVKTARTAIVTNETYKNAKDGYVNHPEQTGRKRGKVTEKRV